MKILLDTPAFLWLTMDSPLLSKKSKKLFLDAK
jgi:PIN domain nuclease of toxin-antitoxin system